jgi:hypothetical protein
VAQDVTHFLLLAPPTDIPGAAAAALLGSPILDGMLAGNKVGWCRLTV